MQNIFEDLKHVLAADERFVAGGKLAKNKIIEAGLHLDARLLQLLASQQTIRQQFFTEVENLLVFDKIKFQRFVSNKAFLPNSYTAYKNKIGLTTADEFVAEGKAVVVSFPYKDCVLEGCQTNNNGKEEIFWNETLAPNEVDRLLEEKALCNFKRITQSGEGPVTQLSVADNLLLKGNNLLALHSLKKALQAHKKAVKLIYIDPPYNTGSDGFGYNDSFQHASWLTFMKNRLEVAKTLLAANGSIWINIDDHEAHYLKVLCDEIFGRENFIGNVIWQKKFSPQNDAKYFSDNHDHILVYAKNKAAWKPNLLRRSEKSLARYANPDNDPRGPWASGGLDVKTYSAAYDYPITTPSGRVVSPPKGTCWRVSKERFAQLVADNRIWFGAAGNNVPRLKRFLSEVKQGQTPMTIWLHSEVGHNQEAKQELNKLLDNDLFKTPKPERLLKQIIEIASDAGDTVLDFFAGSGTTAAVALKLGRRFITVEQMDYIETVTKARLQKVVAGEQGGISKAVAWQGGGSFVYAELARAGQHYVEAILLAKDKKELDEIRQALAKSDVINYQLSVEAWQPEDAAFNSLSLAEQKKLLLESIDANMLYIPYAEMEDEDYALGEEVKKLNRLFYTN